MRAALRLPDDLSAAQQAAVRAALEACEPLAPGALAASAAAAPAAHTGLASLPPDSLLLLFWHLPYDDVAAAALTCAAWAHAGVTDASTRLTVRARGAWLTRGERGLC